MESAPSPELLPSYNLRPLSSSQISEPAYLHYAPAVAALRVTRKYPNYLDALGFRPEEYTSRIRKDFLKDMKLHVDDSDHGFLRIHENKAAHKAMVREFLTEHGKTYWGDFHRDHLEEKDVTMGFWYPRDADREGSRLVEVLEQMFDYKALSRTSNDRAKPKERQRATHVNFATLTGLKADAPKMETTRPPKRSELEHPVENAPTRLAGSKRRKHCGFPNDSDSSLDDRGDSWNFLDETETQARLRSLSNQAKWSRRPSGGDDDHINDYAMSASWKPSRSRPGASVANASSERRNKDQKTKKSKRADPPHKNRPSEPGSDSDAPLASKASQAYGNTPSTTRTPSTASVHKKHAVISLDSSPEREQQKKTTAIFENRASKKTNAGPDSITQKTEARVKDEPLSTDFINHTILRVKADGPGIKARGPIEVDFEVYKTSERLFTSLMSERSLKPEMQKKVSQLTATVNGKETCCRRSHFNDWTTVCRELRKLWDNSPELFHDRFEMDVMLHVDE